ncbi:uncharacterized protein [Amphiura filiformis]|uniref:uncharacterized protein isoform X1 n=1 Tax=Amphiura filiformis TaxID=82378 RepID=UPI003B21D016
MDLTVLNHGLGGLLLDDFSTGWDTGIPLELTDDAAYGFDNSFVPLPYLGGQGFPQFDDWDFGPELAPKFLRNYRTYPLDPELELKKRRKHRQLKYATLRGEEYKYRERRSHRKRHRHHHGHGVTPRADGPGYYDSAHYGTDRSPLPTPLDQSVDSSNPPPAPAPPPIVSSSTHSSQQDVTAPGGPPVADDAGSNSSHSSDSHDSSSSSSDSESSSDTPVYREPERPKERGRPKAKKSAERRARDDRIHAHHHHHHKKHRHRTPEDFYRVERARGISPTRNPPTYEEYQRFYQRRRSPSPDSSISSISTRSSSMDSSLYHGSRKPRRFYDDQIKHRKLFKAASKCTADYLTRLKVMAPHRHTRPPWVKNISDMFYRIGFTVVDAVFEDSEGIITILAPLELVAREIEHLPYDVQNAIVSIRAARVCRKNGGYKLDVW